MTSQAVQIWALPVLAQSASVLCKFLGDSSVRMWPLLVGLLRASKGAWSPETPTTRSASGNELTNHPYEVRP